MTKTVLLLAVIFTEAFSTAQLTPSVPPLPPLTSMPPLLSTPSALSSSPVPPLSSTPPAPPSLPTPHPISALPTEDPATRLSWAKLQNIEFEERYYPEAKGNMLFPKFPWAIRELEGTTVEVEGYTIPIDKSGMTVVLSANPYAACYFCGKSGPASVLTVKLKLKNTHYRIDNYKTFRGKLRLNSTDIHQFYYILENAEDVTE